MHCQHKVGCDNRPFKLMLAFVGETVCFHGYRGALSEAANRLIRRDGEDGCVITVSNFAFLKQAL